LDSEEYAGIQWAAEINLFSLPGIFSLVGQILGLSWDWIPRNTQESNGPQKTAVKKLGEPVVKGIEETVDIFQTIKNDGIMGLWKYLSEKFQDLQATVMDAIRDKPRGIRRGSSPRSSRPASSGSSAS
jgi:hypothetical protein